MDNSGRPGWCQRLGRSRPMRRTLVFVLAVGLAASACSVEEQIGAPSCFGDGPVLIVAQSVPGASLIPCLDSLPAGWVVASTVIDQDGSVVRFDSDRAGAGAARLSYAETCEIGDAVPQLNDIADVEAELYRRPERMTPGFREQKYYVFSGGCVWWEFDFDDDVSSTLSVELGSRLQLVSREALNENIRESFIDEEL